MPVLPVVKRRWQQVEICLPSLSAWVSVNDSLPSVRVRIEP